MYLYTLNTTRSLKSLQNSVSPFDIYTVLAESVIEKIVENIKAGYTTCQGFDNLNRKKT